MQILHYVHLFAQLVDIIAHVACVNGRLFGLMCHWNGPHTKVFTSAAGKIPVSVGVVFQYYLFIGKQDVVFAVTKLA